MSNFISEETKVQIIEYAKQGLSAYKTSTLVNHSSQAVVNIYRNNGFEIKKQGFQPIYPINHNFFSNLANENSAYYAGFLAADGWLSNRNSIGVTIKETDKQTIIDLSSQLSPEKPLNIITIAAHLNNIQGRIINTATSCTLSWTSKQMTLDLNAIGINKNKSLTMKEVVSSIPEISRHHFIRGYLDGDGYVCNGFKNKITKEKALRVGFAGTKEFLEDLKYCINSKLNLTTGYIHKSPNSSIYYLDYNGKKVSFLIKDYLYDDATIFMQRKLDKYVW